MHSHSFVCKNGCILISVIVNFPLEDEPGVSMIAWTTTPWTLPSNLSLCVNPDMDYVKVKGNFFMILSTLN